jgi:hypothetical protein
LAILLATSLLWARPQTVNVAGHYWRQEIRIDRFGPVSESAWCGLLPPDAYEVISRSEVRAHPRIPDGRDCRIRPIDHDDGVYVERTECQPRDFSEPIHDLRCDYRIDRWTPSRTVVAEGHDLSPGWPETGLISARACRGCEREGGRSGLYELILTDGDHIEYRCPLPLNRWLVARTGSRWRLAVGALDGLPHCDTLEPADFD